MNVIFAGTPEFARIALEAIVAAGHTVPLVLTQPDRPAGRGMQLQPSPVKQSAVSRGIPVAQPRSLREHGHYPDDARDAIAQLRATPHDVMVVAAYGLILPQQVLDIPRHGCLNIHGSLLPRWRGAAPIQRAIEAGDAETGVGIMQMEAGLDTGPVALQRALPIAADDTAATLHDKLAALGAEMIVAALAQLERDGALPARAQPEAGVTYAEKIDKAEARLDFGLPAAVLERRIRAFNPFPGAAAVFAGTPVKLWSATLGAATTAAPGTVVAADADGVAIACGDGQTLVATALQKPGGKRLAAREFLQGFALTAGDVCEPPSA